MKDGLLLIRQKFYPSPEQQLLAGEMATANKGTKPKVGGVRFAPNQTVEGPSSHVHFDEKLHDSVVMVTQETDGNFLVKVGFLKILHKYEITFLLPFVQHLGSDVSATPLPNPNLRVIEITPASEGYNLKCEYTAHREGVLREELELCSVANNSASVRVVVQARVMDRHHGTPMLLEGVKCIGAELEYDSEQSEWRGFD
ncbi:adipose-secreted signaling protein [Heteronotia binoei]|uniref:adipose-secreted signaling protein n=1 Tax=Heteronotia binoei TaxID=13085 RepID=UPI00292EE1A2|nr:adipose-secreted signaling protein [Heteronotia binoei]